MIRPASLADIPEILRMAEQFWALTDYDVPFDAEDTTAMLRACMEQGLVLVLDIDGPKGFIAGVKSALLCNQDYVVGAELAWWVDPEHRGHGKALLTGIEKAAKEQGIHFWNMMNLENLNPEITDRIYTRAGYTKSESTYLKVL